MPVLLFVPYYAFRANSTIITNAFHRLPAISKTFELSVRISARLPACPSFNSLRGRYHHCYHSFPQMRPIEESRFRAFLSSLAFVPGWNRVKQVKVAGLESMLGRGEKEEEEGRGMKGRMETDRAAFHP